MIVQHTTGCGQKHWPDPSIGKTWPGKCHNGCKEDDFHIGHLFIYQSVVFPRNYPKGNIYSKSSQFYKLSRYKKVDSPNAPTFDPNLFFEDLSNFGWVSFPTIFFLSATQEADKPDALMFHSLRLVFSGFHSTIADSRPMLAKSSIEQWSKRASGCSVFIFWGGWDIY